MAALALLTSASAIPTILAIAVASLGLLYFLRSRPKGGKNIPEKMKRLVVLETPDKFEGWNDLKDFKVRVEQAPVPTPAPGEVLVKIVAAVVNPSDEGDLSQAAKGLVGPLPRVFGREGSGVVVATGGGFMAGGLMGKKVGVCDMAAGTWQEYVCMPAKPPGTCALDQSLPVESAASFFVNPLTAVGICDVAKRKGSPAFIHTVGNSQLGQMMVKLAPEQGCTIVNMVRKEEGAELLRGLGAKHVVVTSREGWQDELKELISKLNISVAFDAIAGDMSGTMMQLLPEGSTTVCYGGLSGGKVNGLPVVEMIYGQKKFEAFFLKTWLTEGGMLKTILRLRKAFKASMPALGKGGWAETHFEDCTLEEMWTKMCRSQSRAKKLRIRMDC